MSQARLTEFYSSKKTTENQQSNKRKAQIVDAAINQIADVRTPELVRTRSFKKRACKNVPQINTTSTISTRTKTKNLINKHKFTEIKVKEPSIKLDSILKYTIQKTESVSIPVDTVSTSTHYSPKRRKEQFSSPSKRPRNADSVKDGSETVNDDKIDLAESIANTFAVRRNLFNSTPITQQNLLANALHLVSFIICLLLLIFISIYSTICLIIIYN